MKKAFKLGIFKAALILLVLIVLLSSIQIYRNYHYICVDCISERTLSGKEYDGWILGTKKCENYQFNKESSTQCINSISSLKLDDSKIIESKIKVPVIQIFNTIIISKNIDAFVFMRAGCGASFATDSKGNIYSRGGCLG